MHIPQQAGRKPNPPSEGDTNLVLEQHKQVPMGVLSIAKMLRVNHVISYSKIYRIMKDNLPVVPSKAKSRKRKWVRFERKYSNAMWHVDWHIMKEPRFRGLNLVTYLDDSSRCILHAQVFTQATSENAVLALRSAIKKFGTPATILSDNKACFVGPGTKNKKNLKDMVPTAFEAELLNCGIEMINSRPYHPQTNGKLERFHRSIEEELWHHDTLSDYVHYYNERRPHWSLDIDNGEHPIMAFESRKVPDAIRKSNPKWMEVDIND